MSDTRPGALPDHGYGWMSDVFERVVDGVVVESHAVIPLDDVMPHLVSGAGCWCAPNAEFPEEEGCVIYTHHSIDGRELAERAQDSEKKEN